MSTQTAIDSIVREYIKLFPQEWQAFRVAMQQKLRESNSKFGSIQGSDIIERKLFEIPETLYTIFKLKLSPEDWEWYQTKEGSRWFATTFPLFRTSEST